MENISIIVPTYNELKNILPLVQRIHKTCQSAGLQEEIVIVDDDSPDGTAAYAEKLGGQYPIRVLLRKRRRGLSSAVVEGISFSSNDMVGVIDADLSHPPEIIPHLVELLKNNDIVVGSRYLHEGGVEKWTIIRKIVSGGATMLAYPLAAIHDPMSGYFFFHKSILKSKTLKPKGYKILLEIIVKSEAVRIVEYPYTFQNRMLGSSKLGSMQFVEYISQLIDLYLYVLARKIRAITF